MKIVVAQHITKFMTSASVKVTGTRHIDPCHESAEIGYRLERNVEFLP